MAPTIEKDADASECLLIGWCHTHYTGDGTCPLGLLAELLTAGGDLQENILETEIFLVISLVTHRLVKQSSK